MAKRVLVVEDDLLNRMLFCAWLESGNFEVEPVADGLVALEKAREFHPDLIIMDIQLPNISGVKVIEALQADPALHDIPVLAVTGYVGKGEERRVRQAGARDYLPKPVTNKVFVAAVERLLAAV
jgi:two-component system cell cycle response regulator DivK